MDAKATRLELLRQLRELANANGITQADIARTTGLKPSNVSRMLDGKYSCTIDNLIKVADAIDVKVTLVDKEPSELSEMNVALLLKGAKSTGSMTEGYHYIVESLYVDEAADLFKFCQWVDSEVGGCGRANIQGLWRAFKNPDDPDCQAFVKITKAKIASFM